MASKRFNALVITGLTTAVLAGIPALSLAKNYTAKSPAVAVDTMPIIPPAPAGMSTVTTGVSKKHKLTTAKESAKKLSSVSKKSKKLRKLKKHKKSVAKKAKA